ncbi:hypothetical protein AVEN_215252-1, partial [Araneus ventricosus]
MESEKLSQSLIFPRNNVLSLPRNVQMNDLKLQYVHHNGGSDWRMLWNIAGTSSTSAAVRLDQPLRSSQEPMDTYAAVRLDQPLRSSQEPMDTYAA